MNVAEIVKPKVRRTRQQKRVSITRQKLLNAAKQVFAEKGMDLTRIDEITDRADVGKGTFYNYFKGKEHLIGELIKTVMGELEDAIVERCRDKKDLTELMDTIIGVHIEFFSSRWEDFVLYFQGRADLKLQQGYAGIDTPFMAYLERIEELLDSVIGYRLPKVVLHRLAYAVAGFVSGYYSFAVIASEEEEDVDKSLRSLRGALVASLTRFVKEAIPPNESNENERAGN